MQQEKADRGMSMMNRGSNLRPADIEDFNNGLRILARMIARAYLKDLALKHQQLKGKEVVAETTPSNTKLIKNIPKGRLALTVPETAKLLGVDRTSIYDSVISGQIPSVRIGQRIVIPKAALVKILSEADKPQRTKEE